MKVRVYFKKVIEGDVVIDVPDDTSESDFEGIAEREHSDGDCYVGSGDFEMTDFNYEEE